ncbi:MAG: tyrosine--tRNA ligase [Chloroflexi bacterium]|nr:tyrosine--tRNA ligase [Chloroflexota bacterium]
MNDNVFDILQSRGLIEQVTDAEALRAQLGAGPVHFYIGFDSTATSLHAGSLVPIMAMLHLQRAGHHPIALVGSGTTMIGDPSGKTELRQMLDEDRIRHFGACIHQQLDRYLGLSEGRATAVDNADWLLELGYVDFLREIGRHFSVNRMLAAEAYKQRLEREDGLNFIEFNYQLLQAYDYLYLYRERGCRLQMGGNDQWGNILAGVDLIRRVEGATVQAMTFPLLTTASGAKMGKTAGGAVWLDPELTSPYDFYQYWYNCQDADVGRFLRTFSFLPLDEIQRLEALEGAGINEAKRVLAYAATAISHGEQAALDAEAAAEAAFGSGSNLDAMPSTTISQAQIEAGIDLLGLFAEVGLTASRGEAKRLMQQGGIYVNDLRVSDPQTRIDRHQLQPDGILLRAGKKKYHRLVVEG